MEISRQFADNIKGLSGKRFLECFFQVFAGTIGSKDFRVGYCNMLPPKQIEVNGALAMVRTWNPQPKATAQATVPKGRVYIELQGINTQEHYDEYESLGNQFYDRETGLLISHGDVQRLLASEEGVGEAAVARLS